MVPYGVEGTVKEIKSGEFTVEETVAVITTKDGDKEISMMQKWPVRKGRPYVKKLPLDAPLVTGQRVVDTFFPIAKGGVAAVPGPFGSGKTVIQHQLAKWAVGGNKGNAISHIMADSVQFTISQRCIKALYRNIRVLVHQTDALCPPVLFQNRRAIQIYPCPRIIHFQKVDVSHFP